MLDRRVGVGQPAAPNEPRPRPLAIPQRYRMRDEHRYEAPADGQEAERVHDIDDVRRAVTLSHAAQFWDGPDKVIPWQRLAKLGEPGKMLEFLHAHCKDEFDWSTDAEGLGKLYKVKFRDGGQPAAPSAGDGQPAAQSGGDEKTAAPSGGDGQPAASSGRVGQAL